MTVPLGSAFPRAPGFGSPRSTPNNGQFMVSSLNSRSDDQQTTSISSVSSSTWEVNKTQEAPTTIHRFGPTAGISARTSTSTIESKVRVEYPFPPVNNSPKVSVFPGYGVQGLTHRASQSPLSKSETFSELLRRSRRWNFGSRPVLFPAGGVSLPSSRSFCSGLYV